MVVDPNCRRLLEQLPDLLLVVSDDASQPLVTLASDAFVAAIGVDRSLVVGHPPGRWLQDVPDTTDAARCVMLRAVDIALPRDPVRYRLEDLPFGVDADPASGDRPGDRPGDPPAARLLRLRPVDDLVAVGGTGTVASLLDSLIEGFALVRVLPAADGLPDRCQIVRANPAYALHTGLPVAEVVGRTLDELFPGGAEHWTRRFCEVARTCQRASYQEHFVPLDRWFEVHAFPASPGHVAVVFQDISRRREAEATAQEREALVTMLSDHARVGMSMVTAGHRYLFANRAYAEILGLPDHALVGRRVADVMGALYESHMRPRLDHAFAGEHVSYELEVPRRPHWDRDRVFAVTYSPAIDTAHGPCVIGVKVDITDSRLAQAELRDLADTLERHVAERTDQLARARDAAHAASRAKSAFLANMSHEIRTPMNAIIGLTHLLGRELREPRQRERLSRIDEAARHLLQIINDILDLSKIEAGKMPLESLEFGIDGLVGNACDMVRERASAKGLELVVDTDHLPARLVGDPTRLSQALINLLSNAVKFTERGWVRLKAEKLAEDGDEILARFEVQDTGPGIPAHRLEALFAPFEQADSSTSRQHGGTGLGLALTRHIARLMDGDTGVESRPGEGSSFWFTARLARAASADEAQRAPVPLKGLHALVVDDLPEALDAVTERLRGLRMDVSVACDGRQALDRLETLVATGRVPDVMLIDWQMPGVDGIETLGHLRAAIGSGLPPAVLVTAFDDAGLWDRARAAGYRAVMIKPVTSSSLHDQLVQVLGPGGDGLVGPGEALPESPEVAAAHAADGLLRRLLAGRRVLLVEDNPVNQEVAGELLREAGLTVEVADGGEAAVDDVLSRHYDLVLMDVQMPGMDGLEATRSIRARLRRHVPIVAMTANAFVEDRLACIGAGMDDHLGKPVDPRALHEMLLKWLAPAGDEGADGSRRADGVEADDGSARAHPLAPLEDRLVSIDGLDLSVGRRLLGGSMTALARALGRFASTYAEGVPALVQAVRDGDESTRRALAHSLRGACGAIGAVHLQAAALELEHHGADRAGDDADPATQRAQALDAELRRLVFRLHRELA